MNATKFYPGDKILFKSGDSWMGQWAIKNSGSSSNPIYIGNFGSGSVPTISGNSSLKYLISFSGDVKYITIDGLYFKDVDPGGGQGLIYGTIENNHIIIENCKFSQSKASQSSTFAMIYMRDANYISIDNCDLTGKSQAMHFRSNNNSSHNDVHHITISNNNFHDIINGGLGRGIRFSSNYDYGVGSSIGAEGIIRDITINDNNFTKLSGQGVYNEDTQNSAGNPIWLAAGETAYNINFLRNTGYLIENCFFDWGRITNRDGKFDWSYVAGNVLDHCGFDVNGNPTTKYPTNGINTHAWKEVYIQDNIISNIANIQGDGKCIVLDHSVDKTKYYCDGVVIRRNILSGVRHSTLEYAAGIHLSKAKNCKIYNNVCYNNKSGISLDLAITTDNFVYNNTLVDNDVGLWFGSGTATGNTVENNIFANNSNCGIHINKYLIYDYNCFYNNGKNYSGGTPGAHDVNGNPKFKDAANHNYQIMSGSAAIDKGVSIAGLNSDILGNAIQNKIDIGAYEYSSSTTQTAPSTPSLNSPSNGSTGISSSPTLNWNSASGAASYNLQVSLNSNFSSNIFSQSGITSTSKQVSGLSDNTKYYWRVNAQNSAGTSSWSSVHYFTTITIAPPPSSGAYTTFSTDNGTLNGDVRLKTKSGSIGLKVLYFLNTSATAKFNVNLDQSGQWYAWGRMFFESSGSPRSSFYIQVDGGSKLIFGGDNNSFDKWHWEGDGLNKLSLGNLSAGNHTITIYGVPGESGETVMLDQILLTSDADLVASDNLGQETTSGNLIYSADKGFDYW